MKVSLNTARLGADKLSFLELVDLAARHGFDGLDFSIGSAMRAADALGGAEVLRRYMEEKGVAFGSFGLDWDWRGEQGPYETGLASFREKCQFADRVGATRCCTWMPPSVNAEPDAFTDMARRRFNEIGRTMDEFGVRFGLEWVGPRHLRAAGANAMGRYPWIFTMRDTLGLISDIGLPNIGLLVDAYHCYTTGVTEDDLAALSDRQIVHVHINDAPVGVGPEGAKDGERVLPGRGEIPLSSFLRGLERAGYTGFVAAEILAPQNLAGDPETAASMARESLRSVGL